MDRVCSTVELVVRLAKVVELTLDEVDLTPNQYRALTLVDEGAPGLREFAFRLAMKPPNATTLIDGLVRRGLVSRQRDRADGRRIALRLTSAGRELLLRADARGDAALAHVATFAAPDDIGLVAGIDRWRGALDAVAVDVRRMMRADVRATEGHRA